MDDTGVQINFDAPAVLGKWPSINNERVSASLGARPYLIIDGTLDECIRKLMAMPVGQHHLYEIHTAAQSDLVSAVLLAEIIPHYHSVTHGLSAKIYKVFVLGDYTMRKWFKDIDADDIRMAVLASVLT